MKNNLKVIFAERNVYATKLAEYLDVSDASISKIVKGRQKVDIETALKIAKFFNLKVEEIWSLDE